jgi:outer membrane lipoprotein SlyB
MYSGLPISIALLTIVLLMGCTSAPSQEPSASTQGTTLVQVATVMEVRDVTIHGGESSGIGSFVGTVLGAFAGSRIGSGHGSTAASIGGAVAGGMAGQHMAQSRSRSVTELSVRLDTGEVRTYQIEPGERFGIGDTVKVVTSRGVTRVTH